MEAINLNLYAPYFYPTFDRQIMNNNDFQNKMIDAFNKAQSNFNLYFNTISSDFNRLIPAIDMPMVKSVFCDDFEDSEAPREFMWVGEVDFDGLEISGVMLNAPNKVKSVSEGCSVKFPISKLCDWLCVIKNIVYGGYTIQVLRSNMPVEELASHDEMWGINFLNPPEVLVPEIDIEVEMSFRDVLVEQILKDKSAVNSVFDKGRTILHLNALFGRYHSVQALIEHGADINAKCDRGWLPIDYAKSLNWLDIVEMLKRKHNN